MTWGVRGEARSALHLSPSKPNLPLKPHSPLDYLLHGKLKPPVSLFYQVEKLRFTERHGPKVTEQSRTTCLHCLLVMWPPHFYCLTVFVCLFIYVLMCMGVFPTCMSVKHVYAWWPRRSEEDIRSQTVHMSSHLGTGIKPWSSAKHSVPLTTELFLQSCLTLIKNL